MGRRARPKCHFGHTLLPISCICKPPLSLAFLLHGGSMEHESQAASPAPILQSLHTLLGPDDAGVAEGPTKGRVKLVPLIFSVVVCDSGPL